ncbi:MAG: glycerophosphoryl diester phosphodiesterase/dienelactone hydrolase [Pirellulaceae bacterium]|jgi:glycerophosphoryl diester phosphodiesterase/dienelactone hydrolase
MSARYVTRSILAAFTLIAISATTFSEELVSSDDLVRAARGVSQIVAHRGASSERPECTLAAIRRGIEVRATAVEMDVRTSKDGVLFLLHDSTLQRTTNGRGAASELTIEQLKELDAGSWFHHLEKGERIPTLSEALQACRGKIDALLDLKEQGSDYAKAVAAVVKQHGDPARTIVGVRSVEQANEIRRLLPKARQLGLIPNPESIEAFAKAGVETIRLWPRWLDQGGDQLVQRVRKAGVQLHLNGTLGLPDETKLLLKHSPNSLSSDDPARLRQTLAEIDNEILALHGTETLTWPEEDLSGRMMDGAHRFIERKIEESVEKRMLLWPRAANATAKTDFAKSIENHRKSLTRIIGATDERLPPAMERFGTDEAPALVAETATYRVYQVRWPVLPGHGGPDITGEGLLVRQNEKPVGNLVVLPDADQTPEQIMGLAAGVAPDQQFARSLAERGFELVIPTLISRDKLETDDERLLRTDQTHREWIYRQAFQMGRHVIGFDVQTVLAAVDWFESRNSERIGVVGYGEGGLVALYSAAIDTRIAAACVSGYFGPRQEVWSEPIYRNIWGLLREFGDAEIALLVSPRKLVVEYSAVPPATNHKGDLKTPAFERVLAESRRLASRPKVVAGPGDATIGPGSFTALARFASELGATFERREQEETPVERRKSFSPKARQLTLLKQREGYIQALVRRSEHVRDSNFLYQVMPELSGGKWSTNKEHPIYSPKKFVAGAKAYRQRFYEEGMGKFDDEMLPPNARTRKILETDQWTAFDVVLDVHTDLFAWGVLLIPKDIKPGERRPVVVCQHGRNGVPRDTIDRNKTAYNDFAAKLAERGFITFAPHNLYRGEDRYRWLDRKANTVKASLFSFIIAQHDQTLRWLDTLPQVDGERIAFYGLSYGGETAVRVPTILEKYCLSICSGDFNQWTRKISATDQRFSFMRSIEWEMPYWDLGHTFDYAEMTYLMVPRPFMVERGHHDLVGRDRWVAHEYGKVRWLYAQLGLADKTEIEFFQGGHSINGQGTYAFLHKHLNWPQPVTSTAGQNRQPEIPSR